MDWMYVAIFAFLLYILLGKLIRLPTVGRYDDRYVFITGCDSGFGKLLASRLDSLGFHVFAACFTDKGEVELRKVSSARLQTLFLDVTKPESIAKASEYVKKQLPSDKGIWAVVNNAGIVGALGQSEWFTRKDYEACLAVNLYGVIDVTRAFQPLVRRAKGRIVNISSVMGRVAATSAPYVVSKYGVEGFSDCLRREVLKQGITVHILEPGYFKTELLDMQALSNNYMGVYNQIPPEIRQYYGERFGKPVITKLGMKIEKIANRDVSLVVDAYTHAVTAMFPRYRYLVGNDSKYFFRLLWNLPEWLVDRVLTMDTVAPEGTES